MADLIEAGLILAFLNFTNTGAITTNYLESIIRPVNEFSQGNYRFTATARSYCA